jgi:hypothetical protein
MRDAGRYTRMRNTMNLMSTLALAAAIVAPTATEAEPFGASVILARDTTMVGQTKPPSREASPTSKGSINRRTKNDQVQDSISKGICIGCNPR